MMCGKDHELDALRVMLVDDDDLVSRFLEILLCNYGCSISVFNDSKDALEDFRNNPAAYDLVISDVRMPSLTGDRLAEEILAIKPDIPFVLISGYSPDLDVMRLKRLGVKYFLSKPVENKKLMQIVDEFKSLVNPDKFN
ncbi:MAG TPA: response regulator [Gammaproteobacteria bacterium]